MFAGIGFRILSLAKSASAPRGGDQLVNTTTPGEAREAFCASRMAGLYTAAASNGENPTRMPPGSRTAAAALNPTRSRGRASRGDIIPITIPRLAVGSNAAANQQLSDSTPAALNFRSGYASALHVFVSVCAPEGFSPRNAAPSVSGDARTGASCPM